MKQELITIQVKNGEYVQSWVEYGHDDPRYVQGRGKQPCTAEEAKLALVGIYATLTSEQLDNAIRIWKTQRCTIIPKDDNPKKD